ncbi:MAG: ArsC family reductase [Alphaproteobacteria bacterium]
MITVYGLKNCDTCRKARKWMDAQGIAHEFHDLRGDGLDSPTLDRWLESVDWEILLNRRGTTWRKLADSEKQGIDAASARNLMLEHPAMIKRPVFDTPDGLLIGFKDDVREALQ